MAISRWCLVLAAASPRGLGAGPQPEASRPGGEQRLLCEPAAGCWLAYGGVDSVAGVGVAYSGAAWGPTSGASCALEVLKPGFETRDALLECPLAFGSLSVHRGGFPSLRLRARS